MVYTYINIYIYINVFVLDIFICVHTCIRLIFALNVGTC